MEPSLKDQELQLPEDFNPNDFEIEPPASNDQQLPEGLTSEEFEIVDPEPGLVSRILSGQKSGLSSLTLGLSENIPGFQVSDEERAAQSTSSKLTDFIAGFYPISLGVKLIANPISKKTAIWASKSPVGKKALTSLGNLIGIGATGAAIKGAEEAFKGEMPDIDDMVESGAEWALLDLGLSTLGKTGTFVKGLVSKARRNNTSTPKELKSLVDKMKKDGVVFENAEDVSSAALNTLEGAKIKPEKITGKNLKERKVSREKTKVLADNVSELAEELPEKINVREIIERKEKKAAESIFEDMSIRAETEKEFGASIKDGIENEIRKDKDIYTPLYDFVEEAASKIKGQVEEPIAVAKEVLKKLEKVKTKATGFQSVINTLRTSIEDLGEISIGSVKQPATFIEDITVSKMLELKRKLGQIVNYDIIEWEVKQSLKPVIESLSTSVRKSLGSNQIALEAFEAAEKAFSKSAKRFRNSNIRSLRSESNPENIARKITRPTELEKMKNALSKKDYALVEREVVEQMNEKGFKEASKDLRELFKDLSPEARKVAREVVESKNPISKNLRRVKKEEKILNELGESLESGKRPSETIDLWKTRVGRKRISNALEGSPNKEEMVKYLNDQSLSDIVKTVINKEGFIDFNKVKKLLRDTNSRKLIQDISGKQGVSFFNNLEKMSKQLDRNLRFKTLISETRVAEKGQRAGKGAFSKLRDKNDPIGSIIEKIANNLGIENASSLKKFLYLLGLPIVGVKVGAGLLAGGIMFKLLRNQKVMKAFKEASKKNVSSETMAASIKTINEFLEFLDE
jgi:hypothetical protein